MLGSRRMRLQRQARYQRYRWRHLVETVRA